jgi:hypothetical protein
MQFDLGRIIEMIEERFGRGVANGILALVILGVAAFMLHIAWQYGVQPTYNVVIEIPRGDFGWTDVRELLIGISTLTLVILVGILLLSALISTVLLHLTQSSLRKAQVTVRDAEELLGLISEHMEWHEEKTAEIRQQTEDMIKEAEEKVADLQRQGVPQQLNPGTEDSQPKEET